jgi:hypothetical protein
VAMPRGKAKSASNGPRPDVIVDFSCQQGLLFVSLKNIGERSAYAVRTAFDKPLLGLNGQKTCPSCSCFAA